MSSFNSSPWIRLTPHKRLLLAISWINAIVSAGIRGAREVVPQRLHACLDRLGDPTHEVHDHRKTPSPLAARKRSVGYSQRPISAGNCTGSVGSDRKEHGWVSSWM